MKRSEPGGRSDWSGCGTIEGLNSAAASSEYSWVKYAPSKQLPFFGEVLVGAQAGADLLESSAWRNSRVFAWRSPNSVLHLLPERVDLGFREGP